MNKAFLQPAELLARYGLRAKKSWSQNFLTSDRIYRAIVDATVTSDHDWIVEFGAGLGTLTQRLSQRVPEGKILAVERDPDMVSVLTQELGQLDNVDVVDVNALKYDLSMVSRWCGERIRVCGNLPYHIASQLIFHVLRANAVVERAVIMIQKEMADRIIAGPGTRQRSTIGVMVQTYADVKRVAKVPPNSFTPAPRVDSTVLRLDIKAKPCVEVYDDGLYSRVVHAAFANRRKQLGNSLRSAFKPDEVDHMLSRTAIDRTRRGETLTLEEFSALTRVATVFDMSEPAECDHNAGEPDDNGTTQARESSGD